MLTIAQVHHVAQTHGTLVRRLLGPHVPYALHHSLSCLLKQLLMVQHSEITMDRASVVRQAREHGIGPLIDHWQSRKGLLRGQDRGQGRHSCAGTHGRRSALRGLLRALPQPYVLGRLSCCHMSFSYLSGEWLGATG